LSCCSLMQHGFATIRSSGDALFVRVLSPIHAT
jgi:hypothetical protein